jgi:hypothetical protein
MTSEFIYNLPYQTTKWGMFVSNYQSLTQLQLQKGLLKFDNELTNFLKQGKRDYDRKKVVQHIFYNSYFNPNTQAYETPRMLIYQPTTWKWDEVHKLYKFYKRRKEEHDSDRIKYRRKRAMETIECEKCKCCFVRGNIARHRKTCKG